MTNGSGTTTYTYDTVERLSSKGTPEDTLSSAYDAAGNLPSITPSNVNGVSVSYR
jgi:YD repeat-containing protein